jgi:hypothetical protein
MTKQVNKHKLFDKWKNIVTSISEPINVVDETLSLLLKKEP